MNIEPKPIESFNQEHGPVIQVYNHIIPRTKYTKNEISVYNDGVCIIDFYDRFGNYKNYGKFSVEDLDLVSSHKWYSDNTGYMCTTINGKKVRFHTLLFPTGIVDHINGNKLDNTRENLQSVSHAINIAKITDKMPNKYGITGIYLTKSGTWQASIEVNKKRKTKNYKNKEDAILQRFIWEINYWGKNAPQITKIREKYPKLLIGTLDKYKIKDNVFLVKEILKKLEEIPYCPCALYRTKDTKCMCKDFRDKVKNGYTGECNCGLYEAY